MEEQIEETLVRLKAETSFLQPRLSEQRHLPVLVYVFVDKTKIKWVYSAVTICIIAVLL